jgi:hypothetical protein
MNPNQYGPDPKDPPNRVRWPEYPDASTPVTVRSATSWFLLRTAWVVGILVTLTLFCGLLRAFVD